MGSSEYARGFESGKRRKGCLRRKWNRVRGRGQETGGLIKKKGIRQGRGKEAEGEASHEDLGMI